jgi:hypothetical protein
MSVTVTPTQPIAITLTNGRIAVSPDAPTVYPGDTLSFTCAQPFSIQFIALGNPKNPNREQPPVSPTAVQGVKAENSQTFSASIAVASDAHKNRYWDYVVAVYDGSSIVTLDPDIVIGQR